MNPGILRVSIYTRFPDYYGAAYLAESFEQLGCQVKAGIFEGDEDRAFLFQSDILVIRTSPTHYKHAMRVAAAYSTRCPHGILNVTEKGIALSFDKYLAFQVLAQAGLPTPKSYLVSHVDDLSQLNAVDLLPLVVKPLSENRGRGVHVVLEADQLIQAVRHILDKYGSCLVQQYISEAESKDRRVFVCGNSVIAAMERTAKKGSLVTNLAQGGTARPIIPTDKEAKLAVAAAQLFECDFAGVDLLQSSTGPVVLEVNVSPGLKIAAVTGINVAKDIATNLITKRNKK